jgi:hypothetical protein
MILHMAVMGCCLGALSLPHRFFAGGHPSVFGFIPSLSLAKLNSDASTHWAAYITCTRQEAPVLGFVFLCLTFICCSHFAHSALII